MQRRVRHHCAYLSLNFEWLEQCLASIQRQTVSDWQCYVVDGTPEDWPVR